MTKEEIECLQDEIGEILERQNPYPESVFPEPDWAVIRTALASVGITTDKVAGSMGRTCWNNIMADLAPLLNVLPALDRLAELEAAVAFKSFDELPDTPKGENIPIEVSNGRGLVVAADWWNETSLIRTERKPLSKQGLLRAGWSGWRYPVGDLS